MGFSEAQIEELAADQIVLERVKKILSAGVNVPEAEMRRNYEQAYAKMDVSVVRFRSRILPRQRPGQNPRSGNGPRSRRSCSAAPPPEAAPALRIFFTRSERFNCRRPPSIWVSLNPIGTSA